MGLLSLCEKPSSFLYKNAQKIVLYSCAVLFCIICWFYYSFKYDLIKCWPLLISIGVILALYCCYRILNLIPLRSYFDNVYKYCFQLLVPIKPIIKQLYEYLSEFCKKPIHKKPKGLRNIGEFCYMNAMVQALASSTEIFNQFVQLKNTGGINCAKLDKFIDLLKSVNNHQSDVDSNSEKLSSLIRDIDWSKNSQQDTFDLLSALVNSIHRDIKTLLVARGIQMPMKIKLLHKFKGVTMPNKLQDHLGLSIGLCGTYSENPGVSLEYLINEYFVPTLIDDDPDKTAQILFHEDFPNVLLLHIQANKWDTEKREMIKPRYHIQYQEHLLLDLDVASNVNSQIRKTCRYELCAIVQHMGNISGGHYVAYRKLDRKWYLVNDCQVEEISFRSNVCPYILIYEKVHHLSIKMSDKNEYL